MIVPRFRLTLAAGFFYLPVAVLAVVWIVYWAGRDLESTLWSRETWLRDAAVGGALGLVVVLSSLATERCEWARRMQDGFARIVGRLGSVEALILAGSSSIAEELLFRGAMQPALGLVPTSLVFGLLHFLPDRDYLPWTLVALIMGFLLGGMWEWTGNLVAPTVAHFTINAIELRLIGRRAGSLAGSARGGATAPGEGVAGGEGGDEST